MAHWTPRSRHRRIQEALGGAGDLGAVIKSSNGWLVDWLLQETEGAVAGARNRAMTAPETRNVATLTYAAYVPGANWSNPGTQIARHAAGAVATIQQNGIIAAGKTWRYPIVMSNRTAGSVSITGGDVIADTNGTTIITITATGADVIITPTNGFDGDLDLAQMPVEQTDIAASPQFPGAELLDNGDFSAWTGVAPADSPDDWIDTQAGDATSNITQNPTGHCQIISDGTLTRMREFKLTVGVRYRVVIDVTDVTLGAIKISDGFASAPDISSTGVNIYEGAATNTSFYIGRVGACNVTIKSASVRPANPLNGDHTGVTVGVAGNGRGIRYAARYDGATTYTDIYSAELNSMFNPARGTINIWVRMSGAGVWTDGNVRYCLRLFVDVNNSIDIFKSATNDRITVNYEAGGTVSQRHITVSTLDMFMVTVTWDTSADEVKVYLNAVQQGATITGLGTWIGNLASTNTIIGAASTTPSFIMDGDIAVVPLNDQVLTQSEITAQYQAGN